MPLFSADQPGGPRSTLGDWIVSRGPYVAGQVMTPLLAAIVDLTEINALRDELIALRDIANRAAIRGAAAGHAAGCVAGVACEPYCEARP